MHLETISFIDHWPGTWNSPLQQNSFLLLLPARGDIMKKTLMAAAALAVLAASAVPASAQAQPEKKRPYGAPAPVFVDDDTKCKMVRERFWDGYGWRFRRVEVCH